jgi:hypothetical protein
MRQQLIECRLDPFGTERSTSDDFRIAIGEFADPLAACSAGETGLGR